MFPVEDETIAAVHKAFSVGGTDSAVAVLRARFYIPDDGAAVDCVRSILEKTPRVGSSMPTKRRRRRAF